MSVLALASERDLDKDHREWWEGIKAIEKAIARNGRHDLDVMREAGVDCTVLLRLLALAASRDRSLMQMMRQRQAALEVDRGLIA